MSSETSATAAPKRYVLTFPDGLVIPDFDWTQLGEYSYYSRLFPDSGGVAGRTQNALRYTKAAVEAAGIEVSSAPPIAAQFVAVKLNIMHGARHVATVTSHNMAKRIARALNLHPTNERGY